MANFFWSNKTPAAPAGGRNVVFQSDGGSPEKRSAYVPAASNSAPGVIMYDASGSALKYLGADGNWHDMPHGIPAGGGAGQVLAKTSGSDYEVGWVTPSGGSGGGGSVSMGQRAALPSNAGAAGSIYRCTDSAYEFISDGSVWRAFYRGIAVTEPRLATFASRVTPVAGATMVETTGGIVSYLPRTASSSTVISYLRSTSFTLPATIELGMEGITGPENYASWGFNLRNADRSKNIEYCYQNNSSYRLKRAYWTGSSESSESFIGYPMPTGLIFLRIRETTTTRYYEISQDGSVWVQSFGSEARGNYLTLDHCDINHNPSANYEGLLRIVHFKVY